MILVGILVVWFSGLWLWGSWYDHQTEKMFPGNRMTQEQFTELLQKRFRESFEYDTKIWAQLNRQ